jgi:hypothetical protein
VINTNLTSFIDVFEKQELIDWCFYYKGYACL